MAERRKINTRNNVRRRQTQEEEERIARQNEERIARQNVFRDLGFRRDLREIGGNPRRISNNDEIIMP